MFTNQFSKCNLLKEEKGYFVGDIYWSFYSQNCWTFVFLIVLIVVETNALPLVIIRSIGCVLSKSNTFRKSKAQHFAEHFIGLNINIRFSYQHMCVNNKCDLACTHSHSSIRVRKKCVMQWYSFFGIIIHSKRRATVCRAANHSGLLLCIFQAYVSSSERSVSVLWYKENIETKNRNRNRKMTVV